MTVLPLDVATPETTALATLPRLLAGVTPGQRVTLHQHLDRHGPMPTHRGRRAHPLLGQLASSGLRGRGGAGFPTTTKWDAVTNSALRPVVVANGAEGEPASAKDRCLLRHNPHLVLDGAQIAGHALRARRVVIWVHAGGAPTIAAVEAALSERAAAGIDRLPIELVVAPEHFLSGEKTALVRGINGGPAIPSGVRVSERGVDARPTLVQNVETLAHVALLARYGIPWFRSVGTTAEPGTMLATVFGAVGAPGVHEIELGVRLGDVIRQAGGLTQDVAAYLLGGYHGTWVSPNAVDLAMTHGDMRGAGAALGAGLVVALPAGTCGLHETARVMTYLAEASAQQCGPCMFGLPAIAGAVDELAAGVASADTVARLERWTAQVTRRGGCGHPDGAVRFLHSALATFKDDVAMHQAGRPCRPATPVLPTRREVLPL